MEKVENLCRTARAQNELINTSEQFSSRVRDVGSIDRQARDNSRRDPRCREPADREIAEAIAVRAA